MKMILWVEDQESVVSNMFGDESVPFNSEWLLENYHIHWVRDVDEALTAMKANEFDYDYFLLDVALPAFGEIEDFSEVSEDNKETLRDFVLRDGWTPSFASESDEEFDSVIDFYNDNSQMNAGMHLYLYLLHTNNINTDKIRVYSGHIEHVNSFKEKLEEKGIPPIADDYIFTKATDGESKVKKWLLKTVTDRNRILRHGIVDGCNLALSDEGLLRVIYSKQFKKPINNKRTKNHISLIKNIVENVGQATSDSDAYRALLIMLLTSECQEHLSKGPNLDTDFILLAGVLVRIRNMFVHNKDINPNSYNTKFVAMVFLVYMRSKCHLSDSLESFEKNLLRIFEEDKSNNISDTFESLNEFINQRCKALKVTPKYYGCLKTKDRWSVGNSYSYEELLGDYRFAKLKYSHQQYGVIECYRLFLLNFFNYNRDIDIAKPDARFIEEQGQSNAGRWEINKITSIDVPILDNWYDCFFQAFYPLANRTHKR